MAAQTRDKDRDLGKLCNAIYQVRLQLRWVRQTRLDMTREAAGGHYSEDAAEKSVPINVMSLAQRIIGNKLIPKNPRVMLSTFERRHRPAVSIMQDWANERIEEINLANTLRRIVTDALTFVGIAKVAIATPGDALSAGWTLDAGQPFIERVDLDDFVYDIHATDFSECGYMGHRIRIPLDLARSFYRRPELQSTHDPMFNREGDERIGMIGRGYYSDTEEYEDFIDLWEIYLRRERKIVTVTDDATTGAGGEDAIHGKGNRRCLREQKWIGPDCGPYHLLTLGTVAGNPMGRGPLHDCYDLHGAINNLCRKLIEQARNCKLITMVAGGASEDAKRVNETPDGYSCLIAGEPKNIIQVTMNQPNQQLVVLMQEFFKLASMLMGNLELLGGLAPQAKTLGQDKINDAAASTNIGSLQDDTISFVSAVMKSWLWFEHAHPHNVHQVQYDLGHHGLPRVNIVRRSFPDNPEVHGHDPRIIKRDHDFDAMKIRVDPYSLTHQTPQQRISGIIDFLRNIYLPICAQIFQQQNVGLDLNAFCRMYGQYTDNPDLEEIFQFMSKSPEEGGGSGKGDAAGVGPEAAPQVAKEPTEIIRRSQGADSQQAREATNANMMRTGGQNGQQQPMPVGGR